MDVVEDLVRSAYASGFRKILVLNGHGGNDPVRARLFEVANSLPDLRIAWYAWWQSHSIEVVAQKHGLKPTHASWLENFPFTKVGESPKENKIPPRVFGILNATQAREVYGDGSFGGPYEADPKVMEEIFQAAQEDILQLLHFE